MPRKGGAVGYPMHGQCVSWLEQDDVTIHVHAGDRFSIICEVHNPPNTYHVVKVTNLELHDINIECIGQIDANPNNVIFASANPNDTRKRWSRKALLLTDEQPYTFDSVALQSLSSGDQEIHTHVIVDDHGFNRTDSLTIVVTAL